MADINYFGSVPLGKIQSWNDTKSANLLPIAFPGKGEGATEAVDSLGITAYYDIAGIMSGDFETIQSYLYLLKQIADGKQTSSRALFSPFVNSSSINASTGAKETRIGHIGQNTADDTNKLIDANANFQTWGQREDIAGVAQDRVKNLVTGEVAYIDSVDSETQLTLSANIFPDTGATFVPKPYAVSAGINAKIMDIKVRWELPGLTYCFYELSLIQVK